MPIIDSHPTSLAQLRGLTASEVGALKRAGITNNVQLLDAAKTRAQEQKLAKQTGITSTRVREAVNRADLVRIDGIGPAAADLFENAGVNSVKELAQRNPSSLHEALVKYAASRSELGYQVPSESTVMSLVTKAQAATAPAPVKSPEEQGADALHSHIDNVLFGTDPAGASFRSAVLDGRSPADVADLKARMHTDVARYFTDPATERADTATTFGWAGRLLDLYTEVHLKKSGGLDRVYVEID